MLPFYDIRRKEEITAFLDTKIKNIEEDPERKWVTTWNDYLNDIKYFFSWLHNDKRKHSLYAEGKDRRKKSKDHILCQVTTTWLQLHPLRSQNQYPLWISTATN